MIHPATFPRSHLAILALAVLLLAACGGTGDGGGAPSVPAPAATAAAPPPAEAAPAAAGPAGATGTSVVAGKVVFNGDAPQLKPIAMDADPVCAAKHSGPVSPQTLVLGAGQGLGNVFVQVKNPPEGSYPAPTEPAIIDQNGCLYDPHVLGVMAGQTVRFRNSDGILHNVHGLPEVNREFNLGMPPTVVESDKTFNQPEPVFPVKCDVHPWMRTFVAVMSHPFFSVTGAAGEFRIEGLPAGTYEVEAWHEKLGSQSLEVTVGEGETAELGLTFMVPIQG